MFRWRTAYVVDCFYQDSDFKFRGERFHIDAASDDEALAEALFFGPAKNPHHWQLRAVRRKGDAVIYRSWVCDIRPHCHRRRQRDGTASVVINSPI
jgi:hypothetical protein